jgi:hypothetical protein
MDLKTDRWTDDGDNKGDRQINVQTERFTDRQGDKFTESRPLYNPNGDKSMSRVIVNAVFDNQGNEDNVNNLENIT